MDKETLDSIMALAGTNLVGYGVGVAVGTLFGAVDSYRGGNIFANNSALEKVGTGAVMEFIVNGLESITGSPNFENDMGKILGFATGYKVGELLNRGFSRLYKNKNYEKTSE